MVIRGTNIEIACIRNEEGLRYYGSNIAYPSSVLIIIIIIGLTVPHLFSFSVTHIVAQPYDTSVSWYSLIFQLIHIVYKEEVPI